MELKKYLKSKKISTVEFAALIGRSQSFVSQIANGKRRPSADVAMAIQDATRGRVKVLELLYPKQ